MYILFYKIITKLIKIEKKVVQTNLYALVPLIFKSGTLVVQSGTSGTTNTDVALSYFILFIDTK